MIWRESETNKKKIGGKVNISSYLQSSGSEEYAGTGDGLGLEPHKHICPQAVIHVVPMKAKRTHRNKNIASSLHKATSHPYSHLLSHVTDLILSCYCRWVICNIYGL